MRKIFLQSLSIAVIILTASFSLNAQLIKLVEPTLLVNSPASVAGVKSFTKSNDGTTNTSNWGRAIDSFWYMVPLVKPLPADSLGCNPIPAGTMTGKFALIFRGNCQFSDKALAAQNAGALGIIIVNNIPGGPVGMAAGTVASSVKIPVLMISQADGAAINSQMWNGNTVYISLTNWGFGFSHDLGFVNNSLSLFSNYSIPKYDLSNPVSANNQYIGAYIANLGNSTETGINVTSVATFIPTSGNPSVLHTKTVNLSSSFSPIDSVFQIFDTTSYALPSINSKGSIKFDYILSSDNTDNQPLNNSASFSVNVTDSIYSKCRINETTGDPLITMGYRFSGTGNIDTWGPLFYVNQGGHRAISSKFTVSNGTSGTTETSLNNSSVNIYAFKWDDLNSDKIINIGELTPSGIAPKTFNTLDSNYDIFTANYVDFSNSSKPFILSANSWYWFAAEVSSDLYLGCDGEINYYQRSNAASRINTPVVEYWSPQYQGSYSDLVSDDPNANLRHFPFFNSSANIDSIGFTSSKGLVPSITLNTSTAITSIQDFSQKGPEFTVFPNPTNDQINVVINSVSNSKYVTVRIIDGLGRIIFKNQYDFSQKTISINTQQFIAGTYYLTIQEDNGNMIGKKVVVSK